MTGQTIGIGLGKPIPGWLAQGGKQAHAGLQRIHKRTSNMS